MITKKLNNFINLEDVEFNSVISRILRIYSLLDK